MEYWIWIILGLMTLYGIWKTSRKQRLIGRIPEPMASLPLIGHTHRLDRDNAAIYCNMMEFSNNYRYLRVFKIMLGEHPVICLFKPDAIETVLSSSKLITKSFLYRFLHPWLGTGLLTSTGEKWHSRRKMLTPTFHFRILQDFQDVFNKHAEVFVRKLQTTVDGDSFNIFPCFAHCALDIICDTAMGQHVNAQSNGDSDYVNAVKSITDSIISRQKQPWLWPEVLFKISPQGKEHNRCLSLLHGFTDKVIKAHRRETEEHDVVQNSTSEGNTNGKRQRLAFLDLLLHMSKNNSEFGDKEIREEVDTFMFEGHDTTTAAMSWVVHLVGSNPEVQEKIHQEMDDVFGHSSRAVTFEDLSNLKYLECVIKEGLRLFPSVPFFGRQLTEETTFEGYTVPEGATCLILAAALHMDDDIYPYPEEFNPDRFLPENSSKRHPFAFIPFSAGPRNCIGQKFAMNEEKTVLSWLFRNYHVESTQTREELEPMTELILRPKDGIFIKLKYRH